MASMAFITTKGSLSRVSS